MRFSTTPHPFSWGLDLHARRMDVCIVPQDGAILVPRHLHAAPDPCLKAVAPSRAGLVVAVDWLFAWDGLAARGPPEGLPGVRGPALSMHALHGGQATNDTSASPTRAARRSAAPGVWLARREAGEPCPAPAAAASQAPAGGTAGAHPPSHASGPPACDGAAEGLAGPPCRGRRAVARARRAEKPGGGPRPA
jgi:hypothetical protein